MKEIQFFILKYTWLIRVMPDKSHKFNIYNPLAYIALLFVGVSGMLVTGGKNFYLLVVQTFRETVEYGWEGLVVVAQVVLLSYLTYLWLS